MIKGRIVYIDEDPEHIYSFHDFADGFFDVEVVEVKNGDELEDIVDEVISSSCDAVISDYLLNEKATVGFDGQALIEMVQARNKHIPCFLLTSHAEDALHSIHDPRLVQSKQVPFGSDHEHKGLKSVFRSQISKLIEDYRNGYTLAVRSLRELTQIPPDKLTANDRQRIVELDDIVESYGQASTPVATELKDAKGIELLAKLVESVDVLINQHKAKS